MSQQDLFEVSFRNATRTQHVAKAEDSTPFSFLEQTRVSLRLDHLLTISIALMVGMALIYAGGIEKGKRSGWHLTTSVHQAKPEIQGGASVPLEILTGVTVPVTSEPPALPGATLRTSSMSRSSYSKIETSISTKTQTSTPEGSFTIQLATYATKAVAQKKIDSLAAQGLDGFLIPSGSYYQVCVSGFAKREEAVQNLARFKAKGIAPSDAYVRKIPT